MSDSLSAALRAPFDPREVQWKPSVLSKDGKRALALAYVESRAVMDRLDEVVGPGNWEDRYAVLSDRRPEGPVEVECRLALRLDGEWVVKADVGAGDDLKAAYSDAIKRAGVKWGIGRYLYSLPAVWADYDPQRREFANPEVLRRSLAKPEPRPAPVAEPPVGEVVVRTRQGERKLSELELPQVRWLAENHSDPTIRDAAAAYIEYLAAKEAA